jgi:bacillithiol system protein YtxJ
MNNIAMYLLDLISYRDISGMIESTFGVQHESPQLILIRNGESVFNTSHLGISYQALQQAIDQSE